MKEIFDIALYLGFSPAVGMLIVAIVWLSARYIRIEDKLAECYKTMGTALRELPNQLISAMNAAGSTSTVSTSTVTTTGGDYVDRNSSLVDSSRGAKSEGGVVK